MSISSRMAWARRALAVSIAAPVVALAQTSTGNVRGYVTGAGGAPVADAQIAARAIDNNATRGTLTNASGFYYVGGLRPGAYEITVRRVGLSPVTRQVRVPIGETIDVSVSMSESAVQLSAVQVTAAAAAGTETRTSEIGTNVSREQIDHLPNFERNFLDIARLAPGITATSVNTTDKYIAASGQPTDAVNVFVDGATYKSDVLPGGVAGQDASKGNPFPQDAVQEFRVVTQNYKAEYQKAGSAIITATTRSGTNDFGLSAFGFNVNRNLVTRDAITAQRDGPRPQYDRWQAGLSAGGPIERDKLFYFGTYEFNRRTEPANVLFGGDSTVAPAALLAQLRPYTGGFAQEFVEQLGFGKLTWNATSRNSVDASLSVRHDHDFRGFGGQTSYEARENLDINVNTGVVNWKYAGDRWLNEAQATTQWYGWKPTWINGDLIGRNYNNLLRVGGKDTQQNFDQRRTSLRDDVTRGGVQLGGDHVFKVGGNVDFLDYKAVKATTLNPVFNYRRDDAFAFPFRAQFGFGDPSVHASNVQFGGYAQDDWSVGKRLVLNLGLRWDAETNMNNSGYVTPPSVVDSLRGVLNSQLFMSQTIPNPTNPAATTTQRVRTIDEIGGLERFISTGGNRPMYKKAFQPRVGASFDLLGDGRTIVFGGYGRYYDRDNWNALLDEQFRRQYGVYTVDFRSSTAACAAETDATVRARCTVWNDRYLDPAQLRTLTGSVGVPELFLVANDLTPPNTHQFSGGVRQTLGAFLVTASYNGVRGYNYMNFIRAASAVGIAGAPRQNWTGVFISDDRVRTWYDALQLQIQKSFRADTRWGGSIAYTLGKAEEQGDSGGMFSLDSRYPTVTDIPRRRSAGDQRHRIVANAVVRAPFDVVLSTIVNLGSGITVNGTDQTEGTGTFQAQRYIFTPPSRPFLGFGHVFATQQADLRAEKALRAPRGQRVSVVADLFNAFNSKNYGCYNTTIPPRGQTNAAYGTPGCAGLGTRLQLGARYAMGDGR